MDGQSGTLGYSARIEFIEAALKFASSATPDKPVTEVLNESDFLFYRDHLLMAWESAKQHLEQAKASEMTLRVQVVKFAFDPTKQKGTERIELANGYEAKAVKKINYGFVKGFDNKVNKTAIDAALSKIEAMGEVEKYIAGNLVKWTPELSVSTYNELTPPVKAIIDTVIVTSDGAPTLEIVPPKGKR
jgi:hypothetical protein